MLKMFMSHFITYMWTCQKNQYLSEGKLAGGKFWGQSFWISLPFFFLSMLRLYKNYICTLLANYCSIRLANKHKIPS